MLRPSNLSFPLEFINRSTEGMKTKTIATFIALVLLNVNGINGQDYYVYVAAESEDEVAVVKFDGTKAEVHETITIGNFPTEIEGPHGLAVDTNGEFWYLTIAHGIPYGYINKYRTSTNELVGSTTLGMFPATMQMSKSTGLIYAVNFNLHGDHVPSTVSVVDPETMTEITQIETGVMPHGSRLSADGMMHYSLGMMSDELYEIDALTLERTRTLNLANPDSLVPFTMTGMDHSKMGGQELGSSGAQELGGSDDKVDHSKMETEISDDGTPNTEHATMDHFKMEAKEQEDGTPNTAHVMPETIKKPTWVVPHPTKDLLYVALNGAREVKEIDTKEWNVSRTFFTGKGPYNVEVTPDGSKMVVTYKSEARTGIWDLESGKQLAKLDNTRSVPHGVAISPDSKYAFVTVEGKGGEPGTVDIFDLEKLEKVAYAEIGKQAGGIAFWKMD